MLTIQEICNEIELQEEVKEFVLEYTKKLDFNMLSSSMDKLFKEESWAQAISEIREFVGEDKNGFKILTVMLNALKKTYALYIVRGISHEVFVDTMKCFTRFTEENVAVMGHYCFDREEWVCRQVSLNLLRLGELEFEKTKLDNEDIISVHIPSNANMKNFESSLAMAKEYFKDENRRFWLKCWLLSPYLKELLPENSNIIRFQSCFDVYEVNEDSKAYMLWLFQTKNCEIKDLPEKTTLQRNAKKHLLNGGKIGVGTGYLKM